jgi:hypothetical protein
MSGLFVNGWCLVVSTGLLFYFHIVLTGVAIAAASYHFAAMIGAPAPRVYPVIGQKRGLFVAIVLWLLSGPIALMRYGFFSFTCQSRSVISFIAVLAAVIWAFSLGVMVLEIAFRLHHG